MRGIDRIRVGCAVILVFLVSCVRPNSENPAQPVGDEFSFAGTVWTLSLLGGEPVLKDTKVTLEFSDESFSGYSGCNWYGGNYMVTAAAVKLADIGSTARACATPAGVTQQEQAYGQTLYEAVTYHVTDNRLELVDGTGTVTSSFIQGAGELKP